jgi:hypothetical protein
VRYRPLRLKYEEVADYLRAVGWRGDFGPLRAGALAKPQRTGVPGYGHSGAKLTAREVVARKVTL